MAIDFNTPRASDEHPDDGLLEDARMAASSDWEEGFVTDLLARRKQYGTRFRLSDAQRAKLEQIAAGEDGGDLFSRPPRFSRR